MGGEQKWQRIGGALTNVDVSNKDHVWGVNRGQSIYRWTGSAWENIPGKLIQISVGESGVWGVNAGHDIFYRTGTYGDVNTGGSAWERVAGKLMQIDVDEDEVVGTNAANLIFRSPVGPAEEVEPAEPADKGKEEVEKEKEEDTSKGNGVQTAIQATWKQIPGGLTRISKGESGVWGVNSNDQIYKLNADGKSWTEIAGRLVQVSSGASVWGVNEGDAIYKYLGEQKWQRIGGALTNVDVSNEDH